MAVHDHSTDIESKHRHQWRGYVLMAAEEHGMLINRARTGSSSGDWMDVLNPANEKLIAKVPLGSPAEAEQALRHGAGGLHGLGPHATDRERAGFMLEAARRIQDAADELATLVTAEEGKPFPESRGCRRRTCDLCGLAIPWTTPPTWPEGESPGARQGGSDGR